MGSFTAGWVVLVRFPFSDLSQSKLFTAHHTLIATDIGTLQEASLKRITDVVIHLLQQKV